MYWNNNIIGLSDFLNQIKKIFDDHIWSKLYSIKWEVSKIKKFWDYYYIDLIEIGDDAKIKAKIKATLFNKLEIENFIKTTWMDDQDDLIWKEIVINWNAGFHKDYWFSFNIVSFNIEYFLWNAVIQKQKNIDELKKQWIFDKNKNLHYSYPTFHIAVISSSNSEWLRDFEAILNDEKINYKITYFYTTIHWDKSLPSIINAIKLIQKENNDYIINNSKLDWKQTKFDFIAFIRWWWGSEGMNWANDLTLTKEAIDTNIPIITGIWHTSDHTLLDIIAKYPCKTPSEWAKIIIDINKKYLEAINAHLNKIWYGIKNHYLIISNQSTNLYNSINSLIKLIHYSYKDNAYKVNINIEKSIHDKLYFYKISLEKFKNINSKIQHILINDLNELWSIYSKIKLLNDYKINNIKSELKNLYTLIKQNDYSSVIKKWYSLLLDSNNKTPNKINKWNDYLLKHRSWEYEIYVKN